MKLGRTVAALLALLMLSLGLSASAVAQSSGSGPSKWFHHEKQNPNRKKVQHHAKPTHSAQNKKKSHTSHKHK